MSAIDAGRVRRAARWLVQQHLERNSSRPLPPALMPSGIDEAYAVQDAFVELKSHGCGNVVGHKIALTTPQMRAMVGLNEPIAGRLHARQVVRGPASVRAADYGRLVVEFEIAAQMAVDLAPRAAPYTTAQVAAAVGAVLPAFELADDRHADYTTLSARGLELAADNAWNEGAVLGAPCDAWREIDLAAVRGVATTNGAAVGEGRGADSMGHPMAALAWVANHLARRGRALRRGDIVITGSLVPSKFPKAGERLRFEAGALGAVELQVT
ncbi:MAG: fumarylacetoacetate hydrolase family protein [Betaproteobacteria bacterium]|nr:fumarylacetoacetate hydrolase family protein [Betaproteobacteria bacterium]